MATMEKVGFGEKTEEEKELELKKVKELEEQMKAEEEKKEKKGFWSSLGTGVKMGISFAAGAIAVGLTFVITGLIGGDDKDEPEKIEAPEETKE